MDESVEVYDVAVIGAGPAGMCAALYAQRSGLSTAMLESVSFGGQMAQTEHIENYPGFNQSTSGYELAEIMFDQAESFGVTTIYDEVVGVDFSTSPMRLKGAENDVLARSVIVASGARPAKLGIDKEEELLGQGVSYCATCDGNFYKGKDVVIVGGGDTAAADAIYLSRICRKVYMLVRRDVLRATAIYSERLKSIENVEIIWNTIVDELIDDDGLLCAVMAKSKVDGSVKRIDCSALFVAVGSVPNVEFLDGELELDQTGHIVSDAVGKTGRRGVFAAGDVRAKRLRQVTTAIGDGANAAESASEYLATEN